MSKRFFNVAVAATALAVLSGCSAGTLGISDIAPTSSRDAKATVTITTFVVPPPGEASPTTVTPDLRKQLQSVADSVAMYYGGTVGIAVAGGGQVVSAGDDAAYPAWSTIKVPISVAAYRSDPQLAREYAPPAIQASDNAAAEQMWINLDPEQVNQVLAEATVGVAVNTEKVRPEFSTYGQTLLSTSQEAVIASHLACLAEAEPVIALMGQVNSEQAYGLGRLPGAALKVGWGPDTSGRYQVRQLARVTRSDGATSAIALTVIPAAGDYGTAQAMADEVANGLSLLLDSLPEADC